MKTQNFLKVCFCLFLVSLSFSCGKGGDVVDSLIPDLSATWTNTVNADDNYFFLVDNTGVASSNFNGNEVTHLGDTLHSFSGSFQNSKISFTFNDGPKQGTKYSGKINGNSANATMTLATPSGTITLQKHQ